MKQLLTVLFFALLFSDLHSQASVYKTIFEGREVFQYPYRVMNSSYSTDNELLQIADNIDVPYCPLSLPDGDYVAFYGRENHYDRYGIPIILKGDTDNVAVRFSLLNNKKNGTAYWYTTAITNKKIYQEGNYTNDIKEGEWHYYVPKRKMSYHYTSGLLNGTVTIDDKYLSTIVHYAFKAGILHGKYEIINTRKKDKTTLEFVDGHISGPYHVLKHNASFDDLGLFENYYSFQSKFKTIEVTGNLFDDLKYGKWDIVIDHKKITIEYDTLQTENQHSSYGYEEEERSRKEFELFSVSNLRTQYKLNTLGSYLYLSGNNENKDDWQWKYLCLLSSGHGYFTEYNTKGAVLNADSFDGGRLKIPFLLKDEKEIPRLMFSKIAGSDSLYSYEQRMAKRNVTTTYVCRKNDLLKIEEYTVDRSEKKYVERKHHRNLDYYRFHQLTTLPTLLIDSTIRQYPDGSPFVSVERLHVASGYQYHGYYSQNQFNEWDPWTFDPNKSMLTLLKTTKIDDLTLIDTSFISIPTGYNVFNDPDYYENRTISRIRDNKHFFDDTLHLCVLWQNEPFNGTLNFKIDNIEKHYLKASANESTEKSIFTFENHTIIDVCAENYLLYDIFNTTSLERQPNRLSLYVRHGQLNGYQMASVAIKNATKPLLLSSTQYTDNLKNGFDFTAFHKYTYNKVRCTKIKKILHKGHYYPTYNFDEPATAIATYNEKTLFVNGKKEGIAMPKDYEGNVDYLAQYNVGLLNGAFYKFNNYEQPLIQCNFKNDTLNGLYEDFNDQGEVINTMTFDRGLIHGKYNQYQYLNLESQNNLLKEKEIKYCNARKVNTIDLEFNHGYLINTGKYFHCDGILKATIDFDIQDSIQLLQMEHDDKTAYFICKKYSNETTDNLVNFTNWDFEVRYPLATINTKNKEIFDHKLNLEFYSYLPGYYHYYFKSGVHSQEGRVNKKGLKTGWWKFWNENGILMKEILYEKGVIINPANGKDSLRYSGKIKGYYPNGKFMMEGYVLDENLKYECVQDEEIAYQDVFYTRFADENGKERLNNYTGLVQDYHINGNKREEGPLLNTLRNGTWRTYESNGHLNSIGNYKNGLKDGLWLTGDLSGIGFVDNECFDGVIDVNKIRGNLNENKLEFVEEYYHEGEMLKRTTYNIDLK